MLLEFLDLVAGHQHRTFGPGQEVAFGQVVAGAGTGDDEAAGADLVAQGDRKAAVPWPGRKCRRRWCPSLPEPPRARSLLTQDILGHRLAVVGDDQAGVVALRLDGDLDVAGAGGIGTILQESRGPRRNASRNSR